MPEPGSIHLGRCGSAEPDEAVSVPLPWGVEVELTGGFFRSVESFEPQAEITEYGGPFFVAHGSLDTVVDPSAADLLIAAHEGLEELWTAEMDHSFNVSTTTETFDDMVGATIDFFESHAD